MRQYNLIRIVNMLLLVLLSSGFAAGLGVGTFEKEISYTPEEASGIAYFIIKPADQNVTVGLELVGDAAQYAEFRFNNYWYSTKGDKLNVHVQREFNLSGVASATLEFYTKYSMEYGWDFGYIEISTNNGASWIHLNTTSTTTYVDPYYIAWPGDAPPWYNLQQPALTGSVPDWTLETANLTPFAGNVVIIRFRYVTDYFYSEHGWLIDDLSIPEIGFSDDVDSGDMNWSVNGWFNNVIHITDPGKAVPFYIDFTIPSNFTGDSAENKLIVTQLIGADGDFNPGQSSAAILITNLPDFVEFVPPPAPAPSGGGGGGGGGGVSEYYSYRDGVLGFYTSSIPSGVTKTISAERSDTPVDSVSIVLSSVARNAFFSIAPLYAQPDTVKQALPGVYQYFSIDVRNIEPLSIGRVNIRVAVPKAWIESQGKTQDDIVVARYSNGAWSDLTTVFVSESGTDLLFDASSPGFSVFAVRFKSEIPQRPVLKPAATRKPKLSQMKPMTYVLGNESAEKVLESVKGQLQGKTDATKEEMARVFGPEPESPSRFSSWMLLSAVIVILGVLVAVPLLIIRKRRKDIPNTDSIKEDRKLK